MTCLVNPVTWRRSQGSKTEACFNIPLYLVRERYHLRWFISVFKQYSGVEFDCSKMVIKMIQSAAILFISSSSIGYFGFANVARWLKVSWRRTDILDAEVVDPEVGIGPTAEAWPRL